MLWGREWPLAAAINRSSDRPAHSLTNMLHCTTLEVQELVLFYAAFRSTCGISVPPIQRVPGLGGMIVPSHLPFSPEHKNAWIWGDHGVFRRRQLDNDITQMRFSHSIILYVSPYSGGSLHSNANLMVLIACMSLILLQLRIYKIKGQGRQARCLSTLVLAPMCVRVYMNSICIFKAL